VPEIAAVADVRVEQVANVSSTDITLAHWLTMANRINAIFETDPAAAGVVITHGTNTLEETAYFLNLTVKHDKPVVLVGSMRPASAISADGPLNLLNAIRTAVSKDAVGKGVLVALNDEIAALVRAGVPLELGLREMGVLSGGEMGDISTSLARRMQAQGVRGLVEGDHAHGLRGGRDFNRPAEPGRLRHIAACVLKAGLQTNDTFDRELPQRGVGRNDDRRRPLHLPFVEGEHCWPAGLDRVRSNQLTVGSSLFAAKA